MAKQLNVSLAFTADTAKAKGQLKDLQNSLTELVNSVSKPTGTMGLSKELQDATTKAAQLKIQLQDATSSTGSLDLTKFNESLNKSGMSLKSYQQSLSALGPEGDKAFAQLASSIMRAEVPLKRSNTLLKEFGTTLMNTARWQISSSILHGFMSTMSSAYGYAQDLNQSLNNIRIVTGYNTDEMAKFAIQANKAAQALSTTTTDYTDAALIYYQQGIRDDAEIASRTETTIKMANVSRQSAEEVSNQMTAIWNNFVDGSHSLEYYADVITALGAATASSSQEISTGLEKFAAVSKTVGLSYEYATAALATITATTRQSADTVGTGLRTLFSRLEGLSLGETLEDGVNLNKYSKALQTVGVDALTATGDLRQMDDILDDLGDRWGELSDAQKVALAQTVGGVRQYTNLIALMDNWDFMKENLGVANGAEGTLQEQADIYAESWEASKKRVKAAAEDIYDSLLDEDFFIGLNNVIEKVLNAVSGLIDGLGGIPGVLLFLGTVATQVFDKQIASSIDRTIFNLKMSTEAGRQAVIDLKKEATDRLVENTVDTGTTSGAVQGDAYRSQGEAQALLLANAERLSEEETKIAQALIDQNKTIGESNVKLAEELEKNEQIENSLQNRLNIEMQNSNATDKAKQSYAQVTEQLKKATEQQVRLSSASAELLKIKIDSKDIEGTKKNITKVLDEIQQRANNAGQSLEQALGKSGADAFKKLNGALQTNDIKKITEAFNEFGVALDGDVSANVERLQNELTDLFIEAGRSPEEARQAAEELADAYRNTANASEDLAEGGEKLKGNLEAIRGHMERAKGEAVTFGQSMTSLISGITSLAMGISMVKGLGSIWSNDDISTGEKVLSTITTLGMAIHTLTRGLSALNASKLSGLALDKQSIASIFGVTVAKTAETGATAGSTAGSVAYQIVKKGEITTTTSLTAAIWAKIAAQMAENWIYAAAIAIIGALVAIVVLLTKAYNADAEAAKKAAENAKALGEAAEEAKNRLNDIHQAIEGYKSAVEKLEQCTKGTKAWNEALADVHEQVNALLQKYPELLQEANLFNQDGTLNIEILDQFEQKAQNYASAASAAAMYAQGTAAQAQLKSDTTDTKRQYEMYTDYGTQNRGYKQFSTNTVEKDLEKVMKAFEQTGKSSIEMADVFTALGDNIQDQSVITEQYAQSLLDLAESSIQTSNMIDNAAQMTVSQWAADAGVNLDAAQTPLMSEAYNNAVNTFSEAVKKASDQNSKADDKDHSKLGDEFKGTRFEGKSVMEAFNIARGANYAQAQNAVQGTDGNRTYVYLENGEEKKYALEEMQATIAAAAALEQMQMAANEASEALAKMDGATKEFLGSGTLENLNKAEFDKIRNAQNSNGENYFDGEEVTKEQAQQYLIDQGLSEEVAEKQAQAFANALNLDWTKLETQLNDLGIAEILGEQVTEGLSATDAEVLINAVSKYNLGPAGKEAGEQFISGINDMLSGINPDKQQEALSRLLDIDYTKADALLQADEIIKEFGGDTNVLSEDWENFTANLITAAGVKPDFSDITNQLYDMGKAIGELKFGDTIDDEEYQKLVDYGRKIGESWEDFFITQADGSRKFIGDQAQMRKAMMDNVSAQDEELQARIAAVEKLKNGKWGWDDENAEGGRRLLTDWTESATSGTLQNLLDNYNKGGSAHDVIDQLGYDADAIQSILDDLNSEDEEIVANAEARMEAFFNRLQGEFSADYAELDQQMREAYASTASNMAELNQLVAEGHVNAEAYQKRSAEIAMEIAQNATSLTELQTGLGQMGGSSDFSADNTLYYDEYAAGLLNIASQYDSCANAAEQYQNALNALNDATDENRSALEEQVRKAEENLELMISSEEQAKKYGLDLDTLKAQTHEIAKAEGVSEKSALAMAVANERMNRGVATLVNNWSDWKSILKSSEKTAEDYAATLADVSEAVTDLVGWYEDLALDSEFVEENMDLIDKAAEGDTTAILELGAAVAALSVQEAELNTTIANGPLSDGENNAFQQWADSALDAQTNFENLQTSLTDMFTTIQDSMAELENGASLADVLGGEGGLEDFVNQLNAYAAATGMTAAEMQGMLSSIGVTAHVESDYQEQEMTVPTYREEVTGINYRQLTGSVQMEDGSTQTRTTIVPEYTKASVPGEPLKTTGFVEVASVKMEGADGTGAKVDPPKFTGKQAPSSTAKGGGSGNKGGSKKGGGGGGGSSKKETKEKKDPAGEIERYHKINEQISRQSEKLDRLDKAKERAFGPNKQKWYKEELKNLANISAMYEEHLRQSGEYLKQDQAVMAKWGANFGSDGTILNYAALMQKQIDAYNAAVDKYNNSAQSDSDKEAFEAAEKAYEQFLDDLKQYEETVAQHQEDIDKYVDSMIERYDTMKEKTADAIEFRIEFDDSIIDMLDRMIDRLDTWNGSMFNSIDMMDKLNQKTGALVGKNGDLEKGMNETLEHFLMDYKEFDKNGNVVYSTGLSQKESNAFIDRFNNNQLTEKDIEMLSHMPEEERQALMDYAQQRQDNTDALIETAQAIVDNIKNQFDKAKEEMETAAKPIEKAMAALENYAAIIDIVGQDYLGVTDEVMAELRQQSWNVLHEQTMSLKAQKESMEAQRDDLERLYQNALDSGALEMAEKYREALNQINDDVQAKTEEWYASWQAELSRARENFEKTTEKIKNNLLDAFAGPNNTWVQMQQSIEFAKEKAEEFLPEYKQIYELSKLNRDINKSIDDTDNIKNKKALRDLQAEINKLGEEGVKVSQYDIDNARRKYELELARLALEESKNVKDTVRLNKDSEGNWSYIYTADEEDVAAAEQNYEDKLFAMQEANANYINEMQDQILDLEQQYADKLQEIMNNKELTREQQMAMIEELQAEFTDRMGYLTDELNKAVDNNKQLYDEDWAWYADYTARQAEANQGMTDFNKEQHGYRLGDEEDFVTSFNDTILGMQTGYDDFNDFQQGMTDAANDAKDQMIQAYTEELSPNIDKSMEDAGYAVDEFADKMMDDVEQNIVPEAQEARDNVEELGQKAVEVMDELIKQADAWVQQYNDIMDQIISKNDLVIESINKVNGALSTLDETQIGHDDSTADPIEGGQGNGENGGTGGGDGANGGNTKALTDDVARKIAADIWVWGGERSGWYNNPTRKQRLTEKFGSEGAAKVQSIINKEASSGALTYKFDWNDLKNYHYSKFDTGGYTGDWAGKDGRMAMLHQKELVLDAEDTTNFLSAIEIVRSIAKMIDLNAQASEFAVGNMAAAAGSAASMGQLEQTVTITAEFPNVQDRNEIAEAFNTLINQASQYANRKI